MHQGETAEFGNELVIPGTNHRIRSGAAGSIAEVYLKGARCHLPYVAPHRVERRILEDCTSPCSIIVDPQNDSKILLFDNVL